jgi:hypothetical protein
MCMRIALSSHLRISYSTLNVRNGLVGQRALLRYRPNTITAPFKIGSKLISAKRITPFYLKLIHKGRSLIDYSRIKVNLT